MKLPNIKEKLNEKQKIELLFIGLSIFFGILFIFSTKCNDDVQMDAYTLKYLIELAFNWYYTWSSRLLIQSTWFITLKLPMAVFTLLMALFMYLFMKSLYLLTKKEESMKVALIISTVSFLLPFYSLMSAGWISTSINFLMPASFALVALLPIRWCYENKKPSILVSILCLFCLIISVNAEQTCLILFVLYIAAFIYFLIKKKCNWVICLSVLISIISLIYTLTCPGNYARKLAAIELCFPTFNMLSLIDKLEIGVSTTLYWMFVDGNIIVLSICLFMTILIFDKYQNKLIRAVAIMPTVLVLILGPLMSVISTLFNHYYFSYKVLTKEINQYGLFNLIEPLNAGAFQFFMLMFIAVCIIHNIIILSDDIKELISDLLIVIMGVGSRVIMGFSPTVYASSTRTFFPLAICLVLYFARLLVRNKELVFKRKLNYYAFITIVILAAINILSLITLIINIV